MKSRRKKAETIRQAYLQALLIDVTSHPQPPALLGAIAMSAPERQETAARRVEMMGPVVTTREIPSPALRKLPQLDKRGGKQSAR